LINSPSYNSGLVSISVLDGVADKFGWHHGHRYSLTISNRKV
jgi:hypothetical protein